MSVAGEINDLFDERLKQQEIDYAICIVSDGDKVNTIIRLQDKTPYPDFCEIITELEHLKYRLMSQFSKEKIKE